MLSVIMMNVLAPSDIMLTVITLSVVMLRVVMLDVVAPFQVEEYFSSLFYISQSFQVQCFMTLLGNNLHLACSTLANIFHYIPIFVVEAPFHSL